MSNDVNPAWRLAVLDEEQKAKCLLLGIVLFQVSESNISFRAQYGKYAVAQAHGSGGHLRPCPGERLGLVLFDTIDEAIKGAANPLQCGGEWR